MTDTEAELIQLFYICMRGYQVLAKEIMKYDPVLGEEACALGIDLCENGLELCSYVAPKS